ncbi:MULTISPECIES: rhamnan synthesis F family protein [Nitrosomonas]|uniref:Rhamnan synthesis protein F n=2 Tax=Nitrosomonas communis TaxID=44574 RepID=A0A5D3YDF9_9PROT|nr:rhamnan synthesis protein F [Nitrosomonas communis]
MTDSLHFHPHLQSYFLYCKKTVINSQEFTRFFSEVEVLEFKMAIIKKYEVGFSQSFGRRLRLSALYSLESILNQIHYHDRPKNWIDATTCLWKPLLTEFNFPFLKKTFNKKRDKYRRSFRDTCEKWFKLYCRYAGGVYDVYLIP